MLNRMMFIYFVQKQGFLDGNTDYLRNRLCMVQQKTGAGRFQQFYRIFLLRLFHEGLGQPESERAPDLAELLGKVPFLNGGLFDVHDLERDNPDISIPDEAFERVFAFFEDYRWHLDERPRREDKEINPDVLGYIFEKYINQKQMGAYYTKERHHRLHHPKHGHPVPIRRCEERMPSGVLAGRRCVAALAGRSRPVYLSRCGARSSLEILTGCRSRTLGLGTAYRVARGDNRRNQ